MTGEVSLAKTYIDSGQTDSCKVGQDVEGRKEGEH